MDGGESVFLSSDGVRIHARDYGGSGPTLLLIHSTGFGAWMWVPVARLLLDDFRVLAIDQRGHGASDKPKGGYTIEAMAADAEAVLGGLAIESAYALGHSAGATTLVAHSALFPERVRRLLLMEPILPTDDAARSSLTALAEGARRRRPSFPSADAMFESFRSRPPFHTWQEEALRLYCANGTSMMGEGLALKCPPDIEAQHYEALTHFEPSLHLQELQLPVRFCWGEGGVRGRISPSDCERWVPYAESRIIVGAGHFVPMERPEEVAREAREFFNL